MNGEIIDVASITKSFGSQRVLDGVNLRVTEGSVTAVLGPNGAGKSTFVRILTTLTRPDSGTATIAGYDIVRNAASIRSVISLTGQNAAVDELLTGEENMRLMSRLWHLDRKTTAKRNQELLELFDLMDARNKPVKTYSEACAENWILRSAWWERQGSSSSTNQQLGSIRAAGPRCGKS